MCNDTGAWLWSTLGVTCWPTQVILSPGGRPVWVSMGENQAEWVEEMVGVALEYYGSLGQLTGERIVSDVTARVTGSYLSYPGKLTVNGDMMIVSDTGNNRIVIMTRTGEVLDIVGGDTPGHVDGGYTEARFHHPQGVVMVGDQVYVCDTDNHLLRCINTITRTVSTFGGAPGLSSPWDLTYLDLDCGQCLAVVMAGCHQVWLYCLTDVTWWKGVMYQAGHMVSVVGSGKEENRNNSYPHMAGLAQPSGITSDGHTWLYLADSESSSVRRVSLKDGAVTNVAGGDRDPLNLFSYGDIDGEGVNAKLQHPLGVTLDTSTNILYIADSYNHKIKKAEQGKKLWKITSVIEKLSEPGGLCIDSKSNSIFIADTNNHCIKKLHIDTNSMELINITESDAIDNPDKAKDIIIVKVSRECKKLILSANQGLKPGHKLNSEATSVWKLTSDNTWKHDISGYVSDGLSVSLTRGECITAKSTLTLKCKLYLCSDQGVCIIQHIVKKIIIEQDDNVVCKDDKIVNVGSLF